MSLQFYQWLHITSVAALLVSLAALWGLSSQKPGTKNKPIAILHGIGMTLLLVSGFGLLARLGMVSGLPWWIYVKIALWLIMGGSMILAKRKAQWGFPLLLFWIAVVSLAAYFGVNWAYFSPPTVPAA